MSKRITKVKFKTPTMEIHSEEHLGSSIKESIFKCTEEAHPDFKNAFDVLIPHVYRILELPRDVWPGALKVTSVSFSMSEETKVEGAVITGIVALDNCQTPFCFNTPHLPFAPYTQGGEGPVMDIDTVEALDRLRIEAEQYMSGSKRAQLSLAV